MVGGLSTRPDFFKLASEEAVRLMRPVRGRISRRLSAFVKDQVARIASPRRRNGAVAELCGLSDRELADIGLARSDLPRIMDPAFIADHEQRGQFIAA
jgi:uncharacterized protein YjiS (DUF1127 family)